MNDEKINPVSREVQAINNEINRTIVRLRGLIGSMFEMTQTFGSMTEASGSEDSSENKKLVAKLILRERRRRTNFFNPELFGEPAWDMLLELYVHHLDQSRISVSSLCSSAGVPATTALRWIGNLERAGLVMRRKDFMDGRRVWIELTSDGTTAVDRYFDGLVLLV